MLFFFILANKKNPNKPFKLMWERTKKILVDFYIIIKQ